MFSDTFVYVHNARAKTFLRESNENVTFKYRNLHLFYEYIIFLNFQWSNGVCLGLVVVCSSLLEVPSLLEQDSESKQRNVMAASDLQNHTKVKVTKVT